MLFDGSFPKIEHREIISHMAFSVQCENPNDLSRVSSDAGHGTGGLQPDVIIHRIVQPLLAPQVSFCRLADTCPRRNWICSSSLPAWRRADTCAIGVGTREVAVALVMLVTLGCSYAASKKHLNLGSSSANSTHLHLVLVFGNN
jgi:hypothetical protein